LYQEKKLKNLVYGLSGLSGNAATRIETFYAPAAPSLAPGRAFARGSLFTRDGVLAPSVTQEVLSRFDREE
jgi:hypothetical protein